MKYSFFKFYSDKSPVYSSFPSSTLRDNRALSYLILKKCLNPNKQQIQPEVDCKHFQPQRENK